MCFTKQEEIYLTMINYNNFKGSNHLRCSIKKGVLKNFAKFTGKHLCRSLFLVKLQTLGRSPPSLSKWRATVSGELMLLESYCICDVTNTVTLHL